MYEETSGLTVGDPVACTGQPLSVQLGPGVMGRIYDGIQRPLEKIAEVTQSIYIPRGIQTTALDDDIQWPFTPLNFRVGDAISGGDIYGTVPENNIITHHVMAKPGSMGTISYLAPKGSYTIDDVVLKTKFEGKETAHTMQHFWPVRTQQLALTLTLPLTTDTSPNPDPSPNPTLTPISPVTRCARRAPSPRSSRAMRRCSPASV